eukprot:TRINITY_DN17838_c0_g1_i1.p1 TRINITY_DN17838_c0_g1~~TRINITY_DN17838_c0_g1_i1.p1  ORF type:complete len:249 (+),score=65.14 TRINITY_DN17838_c0_g1_i1:611-1357(+)
MPPKKKDELVKDETTRPRSQADADLEAAKEETRALEVKLEELCKRVEDCALKASKIRKLEEQLTPLEDSRKKVSARFKKILSDRPESANSSGGLPHTPDSREYRELLGNASEVIMKILTSAFKHNRAASEDDNTAPELKCPLGISPETHNKVLELRLQRIGLEEEIESIKEIMMPLKEQIMKEKAEGIGKPLIKRTEKVLQARKEEEREALKRVTQEDDEWHKAKEEEEWQRQLRAQVEDSAKKGKAK